MAQVTVRRRGKIRVELSEAVQRAADAVVLHILRRTGRGLDASDSPLPAYSPLYRQQLAAIGESTTPDMRLTGELMRRIKLQRTTTKSGVVRMHFGPGGARLPRVALPPWWCFDLRKTPEQRAKALARWRRSRKSAKAKSAALVVMSLAKGVRGRGRRRVLGISPSGARDIKATIEASRIFKS